MIAVLYIILMTAAWIGVGIPIVSLLYVLDKDRTFFYECEIEPGFLLIISMAWPMHAFILLCIVLPMGIYDWLQNKLTMRNSLAKRYTKWLYKRRDI